MKWFSVVAFSLLICSCAWNSGVQQIGSDTYQVSANASPARGAGTGARRIALKKADDFCRKKGGTIEVIDEESEYAFPANRVVTIKFKCRPASNNNPQSKPAASN